MTIAGGNLKFDWTVKFSDALRIVIFLIGIGIAYERVNARVDQVERIATETSAALQKHMQEQNEVTTKALGLLNRMMVILEDYPPHRHTKKGEIIYPARNSDGTPIAPPGSN